MHDVNEVSSFEDVLAFVNNFIENVPGPVKCEIPDEEFSPFVLDKEQLEKITKICVDAQPYGVMFDIEADKILLIKMKPAEKIEEPHK